MWWSIWNIGQYFNLVPRKSKPFGLALYVAYSIPLFVGHRKLARSPLNGKRFLAKSALLSNLALVTVFLQMTQFNSAWADSLETEKVHENIHKRGVSFSLSTMHCTQFRKTNSADGPLASFQYVIWIVFQTHHKSKADCYCKQFLCLKESSGQVGVRYCFSYYTF